MTFNTIKSLLFLTEADMPKEGPVALEDLVNYFPSKHKAAIEKLWGSDRLTFHGQQFFSGMDHGPVYDGAMKAAVRAMAVETVNIEVYPGNMPTPSGNKWRGYAESAEDFEADVKLLAKEAQEVYLGYQPSSGNLFIGYDVNTDEDDLESHIESYSDRAGEHLDLTMLDKVESYIKQEAQDQSFYGVLLELVTEDGKSFKVKDVIIEPEGFYKGIYSASAHLGKYGPFSALKLIDLRLD
jgi:hypothetical protein